ncbi:MAG: undecaprenyl-phosphate glucose phosphotransferase [Parvibaculum sp.]|uniref:undecaprenyl-phosphate glucose phosphotransferase n=1 Tax=Parvibaculum sp. TaxID=2024848 RepID=UPI0025CCAC31|nr:undecaprenyl-phosphate glucose phosphotransferase [Parvibaculum sp.]MCE9649122.1 undecaprenyl-phosphate glucose phosphotransferase [Parvibaculum sp.]
MATLSVRRSSGRRRFGIRSERVVGDIVTVVDFVLVAGVALLAKWLYIGFFLSSQQEAEPYLALGVLAALIAVATFRSQDLYSIERLRQFRGAARRIAFGLGLASVIILSGGYLFKVSAEWSRGWMIIWILGALLVVLFNHYLASRFIRSWIKAGFFARNVAVYGSGEIAAKMLEHLSLADANQRIVGVFDDLTRGATPQVLLAGGLSDLIQTGQTVRIDEVLLALPMSDEHRLSKLVTQLSVLPADIRLCPDMAAFQMRPLGIVSYDGVPVLELVRKPLGDWAPFIKAFEDRFFAALALLLLSPLMICVALAIKFDSRGPIFFRQRRHGFNHQVITVLKFRTMRVTQDGPVVPQASKNDPRVTRVGKWLRRSSLDELPQLMNVLAGEMSLVGPRPHALAHNEHYSALLETYANRHRMKPGITGWAQVNGYRGETDTPDKMRKRVECDLYYIENWSLWFDLKILLLTPFFGLFGKNAF